MCAPSLPRPVIQPTSPSPHFTVSSSAPIPERTWRKISDPDNLEMRATSAVAFDAKNPEIIYAGTSHLPWKTPDGGKTWESIHVGMIDDSDVFSIAVDNKTPEHIFASACSGIYASLDRGEQWHKLQGIPNTHRRTHIIRQDPGRSRRHLCRNHAGSVPVGGPRRHLEATQQGASELAGV